MEPALNENAPDDPRDTSTPEAMVATMHTLLVGEALSGASRELLLSWLRQCRTGAARLRAGLPAAWRVGDKTGTGDRGAVNDLAIAWPPDRPPVLIAAYLSGSERPVGALEAVQAQLGAAVAAAFADV
jgi:beta-lactamase class A